mmetsp:Transcript_2858/g.5967  ORF Transcript_2858/g.5967 Transcript_2858/m.5967 type:complete len:174 (-) Transcript_2858:81-602(-)
MHPFTCRPTCRPFLVALCAAVLLPQAAAYSRPLTGRPTASCSRSSYVGVRPAVFDLECTSAAAVPLHGSVSALAVAPRAGVVRMDEAPFWENVLRFARFSVTTITGLILGLLSPFAAFGRSPLLAAIGASLLLGVFVFLFSTLTAMQQSPVDAAQIQQAEPSVQSMMKDLYGP